MSDNNRPSSADQLLIPRRKKWWDPIANFIFPHRQNRRRRAARRAATVDPRNRMAYLHSGYPVHPMSPGQHTGMYPAPYPAHAYPYYNMPPPPIHYPPPIPMHGMHAPHLEHGFGYPMASPGHMPPEQDDDMQSEVSIMDPNFYRQPSPQGGKQRVHKTSGSYISHQSKSHPQQHPKQHSKHKMAHSPPPPTQQELDIVEKYNRGELDDAVLKEDMTSPNKSSQMKDGSDPIKGFDSFMMY